MSRSDTSFTRINSTSLATVLKKAKPTFEGYKIKLDKMTSDIKEVEDFLKQTGISQKYECFLLGWTEYPEENPSQKPVSADKAIFMDYLCWKKPDDGNSFRLFHELYYTDEFTGETSLNSAKPLLESSVNVRIRLFPHLGKFITGLSESIKITEINDPDDDDFYFPAADAVKLL